MAMYKHPFNPQPLHSQWAVSKITYCIYINIYSINRKGNAYDMASLFAHKEIFVQEFKPASYFCDWNCVHLIIAQ